MNEKELGKALLKADLAGEPVGSTPSELTKSIMARDQRRIRWLTIAAVFLWVCTAAGVALMSWLYVMLVAPRLRAYAAGRAQLQNDWQDWAFFIDVIARSVWGFVVPLLLAAICTILLIFLSRRATLRQINASLAEISEQLKLLRGGSTTK